MVIRDSARSRTKAELPAGSRRPPRNASNESNRGIAIVAISNEDIPTRAHADEHPTPWTTQLARPRFPNEDAPVINPDPVVVVRCPGHGQPPAGAAFTKRRRGHRTKVEAQAVRPSSIVDVLGEARNEAGHGRAGILVINDPRTRLATSVVGQPEVGVVVSSGAEVRSRRGCTPDFVVLVEGGRREGRNRDRTDRVFVEESTRLRSPYELATSCRSPPGNRGVENRIVVSDRDRAVGQHRDAERHKVPGAESRRCTVGHRRAIVEHGYDARHIGGTIVVGVQRDREPAGDTLFRSRQRCRVPEAPGEAIGPSPTAADKESRAGRESVDRLAWIEIIEHDSSVLAPRVRQDDLASACRCASDEGRFEWQAGIPAGSEAARPGGCPRAEKGQCPAEEPNTSQDLGRVGFAVASAVAAREKTCNRGGDHGKLLGLRAG